MTALTYMKDLLMDTHSHHDYLTSSHDASIAVASNKSVSGHQETLSKSRHPLILECADSASMDGQRFSYMGGRGGPLWQRLVFNLAPSNSQACEQKPGCLTVTNAQGEETSLKTKFLDYIEAQLLNKRCASSGQLPFEFTGGFVGYLGYEIRAECGSPGSHDSPHPDAAMFFADRSAPHLLSNEGLTLHLKKLHSKMNCLIQTLS